MNTDKKDIEKEFSEGREIIIQHLFASTRKVLTALIIVATLFLTDIISAVAQLNLEIKFDQEEYFKALANYIVTSSSEWFLFLYSSLGGWLFITVAIQMLCFLVVFRLVNEIDNLFKSRSVYIFFGLSKFLLILSFYMLLVFAFFTKIFIDHNPIAKDALDKAVAMHQIRYYLHCNEDNAESRKQCQRIVESILAGQK